MQEVDSMTAARWHTMRGMNRFTHGSLDLESSSPSIHGKGLQGVEMLSLVALAAVKEDPSLRFTGSCGTFSVKSKPSRRACKGRTTAGTPAGATLSVCVLQHHEHPLKDLSNLGSCRCPEATEVQRAQFGLGPRPVTEPWSKVSSPCGLLPVGKCSGHCWKAWRTGSQAWTTRSTTLGHTWMGSQDCWIATPELELINLCHVLGGNECALISSAWLQTITCQETGAVIGVERKARQNDKCGYMIAFSSRCVDIMSAGITASLLTGWRHRLSCAQDMLLICRQDPGYPAEQGRLHTRPGKLVSSLYPLLRGSDCRGPLGLCVCVLPVTPWFRFVSFLDGGEQAQCADVSDVQRLLEPSWMQLWQLSRHSNIMISWPGEPAQ
eukprot:6465521-Amphidinium_carterae.1